MSELLEIAIKAHGGVDRWNKVNSIKVDASITGTIWCVKGRVDVLKDVVITAETKRERLKMEFSGQNKRSMFQPDRVVIQTAQGKPLSARDDPRKSFEGQTLETPWLKVTFPDNVRSHTRMQISCFGPDGLLRRHDYTVDILGGAKSFELRLRLPPGRWNRLSGQPPGGRLRRRLPAGEGTGAGRNRYGKHKSSLRCGGNCV